jgi:hypothetical protein
MAIILRRSPFELKRFRGYVLAALKEIFTDCGTAPYISFEDASVRSGAICNAVHVLAISVKVSSRREATKSCTDSSHDEHACTVKSINDSLDIHASANVKKAV